MKQCCNCRVSLPLDAFGIYSLSDDGRRYECKQCRNVRNKSFNHHKIIIAGIKHSIKTTPFMQTLMDNLRSYEWKNRNPEKRRASIKKWDMANGDKKLMAKKRWIANNREHFLAWNREHVRKRKSRLVKCCPSWADRKAIREIYRRAVELTKKSGTLYEVDHIYPLHGKMCCGLHVETNLQILPASVNRRKQAKMPDHPTEWLSTVLSTYHAL